MGTVRVRQIKTVDGRSAYTAFDDLLVGWLRSHNGCKIEYRGARLDLKIRIKIRSLGLVREVLSSHQVIFVLSGRANRSIKQVSKHFVTCNFKCNGRLNTYHM